MYWSIREGVLYHKQDAIEGHDYAVSCIRYCVETDEVMLSTNMDNGHNRIDWAEGREVFDMVGHALTSIAQQDSSYYMEYDNYDVQCTPHQLRKTMENMI